MPLVWLPPPVTENGVPPSGNTRAVVSQSVAGRAPGVVGSKWRE